MLSIRSIVSADIYDCAARNSITKSANRVLPIDGYDPMVAAAVVAAVIDLSSLRITAIPHALKVFAVGAAVDNGRKGK